jgi:hypothetical protein
MKTDQASNLSWKTINAPVAAMRSPDATAVPFCADRTRGAHDFVRVIRDPVDIAQVAEFWRSCRVHRDADLDHFLWALKAFPHVLRPHILAYYKEGVPRALLIGRCELRSLNHNRLGYFRIPMGIARMLTFINGGHAGEVSGSSCALFIDSIRASLAAGEADAATIVYADIESPLHRLGRSRPGPFLSDRLRRPSVHRFWKGTPEQGSILAGISRQERHQKNRKARWLLRDFDSRVEIASFYEQGDVEQLVRDAEFVAKKSYQRQLGVGFADSAEIRRRLEFEAQMGWLRSFVLYLAGNPSAFWISSLYRGTLYLDFTGFDPALAKYSPGIHLMMGAFERLGAEPSAAPLQEIDFGVGEAEYKRRLGNHSRQESCLFIFAPTWRGLRLSAAQALVTACNNCASSILTRTGALSRAKRTWRQRLNRGHR